MGPMETFLLILVFFSSLLLVKGYQIVASSLGLYDVPNTRSSHSKPIPLGAGITFVISLIPAVIYLKWAGFVTSNSFYLLAAGATLCTLLGFIDDLKHLSAKFRLIVQFVVSVGTMLYLTNLLKIPFDVRFLPFDVPVVSFIFGVLFVMWMINLFNFMDGLDGLLGSQVFLYGIASYGLCYLSGNSALGIVYLLISALTLPFLIFNWRPAKIFMGDAGAYFFGFCFAFLGLVGKIEYEQSLVAQVILMGALIFDATFTLISRALRSKKCMGAHREHLFHRLKDNLRLRTSRIVSIYILLTAFILFPISIFSIKFSNYAVQICLLTYFLLLTFYIFSVKKLDQNPVRSMPDSDSSGLNINNQKLANIADNTGSFIKLFFLFIKNYGNNSSLSLCLLFFGAVTAGILELAGLVILYYLIRVLLNYEALSESHIIKSTFHYFEIYDTNSVIFFLGLAITLIFIAKNFYVIGFYYFQNLLLKKWKISLSSRLMKGYIYAPYESLLSYNTATIIRNINSLVSDVIYGFMLSGLNFFSNLIVAVIIMTALLYNYFTLTMIIGSLFIVSTLAQSFALKRKSIQLGQERNKLQTQQNKHIFQGLHSIKETKVYRKENFFLKNFEDSHKATVVNDTKYDLLSKAPTHITEVILIISIVSLCSFVILENINSPEVSIATLGLLAAVSFRVAPIMNRIIFSIQSMNKNISSIKRIFNELDVLSKNTEKESLIGDQKLFKFENSITFENVSYRYPGSKKTVLKDINFSVLKGEKIAIVGSSGTGKSTLVSLLLGLLKPTKGEIKVDEAHLGEVMSQWLDTVSYVPQEIYISDDNLENNVAFGVKADKINLERVEEVLKQVELFDFYTELNNSKQKNLGENGKRLSGGQKQRVGIARAIYRNTEILIMDEPTSSLDMKVEHNIMNLVMKSLNNQTIFFITHRLSSIIDFDKILFLVEGEVADFGSFDFLMRNTEFKKLAKLAKLV
jgi:ABC-type multidrug transport system fused ATPase/permease subunit